MIWHVQQNIVKCFMIPLPRFSYMYWLIHFKEQRVGGYLNNGFFWSIEGDYQTLSWKRGYTAYKIWKDNREKH